MTRLGRTLWVLGIGSLANTIPTRITFSFSAALFQSRLYGRLSITLLRAVWAIMVVQAMNSYSVVIFTFVKFYILGSCCILYFMCYLIIIHVYLYYNENSSFAIETYMYVDLGSRG